MKSREYWQKRSEQIANMQNVKADNYSQTLKREYERATQSIIRDMEVFFAKFADDNGLVDMASARKLLSSGELREFKMTLEDFIEKAKDNLDDRWTKQLNNAYYKVRISRLEELQLRIRHQVEILSESLQDGSSSLLSDIYEDTYYRTIFEVHKGSGIGIAFAKVSEEQVKKVITRPWVGQNFSQRIWNDKEKLLRELETNMAQAFIRGDSLDRTTQGLAKRMGVSYSNAARIVRTESSHITNEATWDGYKASGVVDKYQYLATLDSRTSNLCQSMDLQVFKLSEKEVGINFPPLHANCRSTVMPYFDDEDLGRRIARDEGKNTYYVPGDMTYRQWREEYS